MEYSNVQLITHSFESRAIEVNSFDVTKFNNAMKSIRSTKLKVNEKLFEAFLFLTLLVFTVSCVVEDEEDPQPTDIEAEIQAALNDNVPFEEILAEYSKTQLLGKTYQGGFIAYIDDDEDDRVVLIAASGDIVNDVDFYDDGSFYTEEYTSPLFGQGESNTQTITSVLGSSGNVAALCANYSSQGFSDWFLPSSTELGYIRSYVFKKGLGNFPGGQNNAKYYWHSTLNQGGGTCPEGIQFVTGTKTPCVGAASVRAARYYFY